MRLASDLLSAVAAATGFLLKEERREVERVAGRADAPSISSRRAMPPRGPSHGLGSHHLAEERVHADEVGNVGDEPASDGDDSPGRNVPLIVALRTPIDPRRYNRMLWIAA